MEHWAKKFFKKVTLKHLQNTFGHFWEGIWAFFDFWKFFDFFENFRRLDPPWNTGQKFFSKKSPLNLFKTRWDTFWKYFGLFWNFEFFFDFENFRLDTFGDDFGHFWIFETFLIFLKKFEDSTLHGTLGKKNFQKNHPKTSSKHVWTLLGTILGIFGILKIFWFFWKFSMTRPSLEHWAKNFFEKITPKHVQNTFGHFWDRIWAFLEFWKYFDFVENFRRLDPPRNTGQKNSSKKSPLNLFKTRWDTFWDDFGLFWNFEIFFDFEKFRLDTFGDDFGHFWIFETFLIFLKLFEDSTLHGTLGKKFFWKNRPKTFSKHVWTFWDRFWAFLEFWKIFDFFRKFSKTRLSMEHWAKKIFEKVTLKHLQNTFGHFWEGIWAFLEFWKFFDFFGNFRRLDPPWNTGQKIFLKKSP